jgi:hypothetical protein
MLNPATNNKTEIDNNNDPVLPSIYGIIVGQKSQKDYNASFPTTEPKKSKLQFILSILNNILLSIFFPYKSLLDNVFIIKIYWITLITFIAYFVSYFTLLFPLKHKLYISNVIKVWIMMYAVLIFFMVINKKSIKNMI